MGLGARIVAAAGLLSLPLSVVYLFDIGEGRLAQRAVILAVVLGSLAAPVLLAMERCILRGMKQLVETSRRIERGDLSVRMPLEKGLPPEVSAVYDSFNRLASSVQRGYGGLRIAEERLSASEAQYHSLFEDSPVSLWLLDLSEVKTFVDEIASRVGLGNLRSRPDIARACSEKTRVLDVNRATITLFRASGREYLLRSINNILGESPREKYFDMLLAVAGGSPRQEFEIVLTTLRGEPLDTIVRWSVIPGLEATYKKVIFSVVDITARKAAEREAQIRDRQLFEAAKMASLGVFVSGIIHELSNPNAYIAMNADSLMELFDPSRSESERRLKAAKGIGAAGQDEVRRVARELALGIREGSARIRRLTEELKRFARREEAAPFEPVDLNAVVASALVLLKREVASATSDLTVRYADSLPPVMGRYQQLEQVVINIVANACQSLEDRSRAIRIALCHDAENREIRLVVEDEGSGIAPELVQRLGDPFFTTRSAEGGVGLGLAVSSRIVEDHGGRTVFDSQPGKGTRVTVALPAGAGEAVPA